MNCFDQKFGPHFLSSVPCVPGVYRFYDEQFLLIYVGKAKNLRRRLSQYRNAKRRKKHRKMNKILGEATKLEFEICGTDLDAKILEAKMIQTHRPKWNVAGAFYFLYPMIGMKEDHGITSFIYTTQPEFLVGSEFMFHGAFRSRERTLTAFFSLVELLRYIGHPVPKKRVSLSSVPKFSYIYEFRQLPGDWSSLWSEFWQGKSKELLEHLVLELVENAGARGRPQEIQESIRTVARFWRHEASLLWKARKRMEFNEYPVSQKDRDILFLKYRESFQTPIGIPPI
jgi:excinuclease ABC subunit C